jgi:hypothetical protein
VTARIDHVLAEARAGLDRVTPAARDLRGVGGS